MTVRMRPRRSARITLAIIALLCAASGLAGQETVTREFRFSSDLRSRSVVVDFPYATISVEGWAGDSVRVALTPEAERRRELPPVSLAEGRLVVADPGNQELLDVLVRVPRDADVSVRGSNGGDVTISGMHGSLEIENSNGGILISGSRGGVVAATSNGPIVAEVERMPEHAPLSFLTSNDSVRIVLPADADAELYLETDNAVVRTDFDVVSGRPAQAPPRQAIPVRSGGGSVREARWFVCARTTATLSWSAGPPPRRPRPAAECRVAGSLLPLRRCRLASRHGCWPDTFCASRDWRPGRCRRSRGARFSHSQKEDACLPQFELAGVEFVQPRRTTFYRATEIVVREPAGENAVTFAEFGESATEE